MTFDEKIEILISYIRLKILEHDWHAVSDAANDLRVLEADYHGELESKREGRDL